MDIKPIILSLSRHKTAAALITLQIAMACAIVCNAVFLISERLKELQAPSGVDEAGLVRVLVAGMSTDENAMARTREDLMAIRAVPGVIAAEASNVIPFGYSSWGTSVNLAPDQDQETLSANMYLGGPDLVDALGITLVTGDRLDPDAYSTLDLDAPFWGITPPSMLITREVAERAFPGEDPVGKSLYLAEDPIRVVGVVDRLLQPNPAAGEAGYSILLPVEVPYSVDVNYLVRTMPERRQEVLDSVVAAISANRSDLIVLEQQTFEEIRAAYYSQDRTMVWLLVVVCIAILVVTALGIVGLASFWVQQRTRQIGIRRALGATRSQILRYFQLENFLLASVGIGFGMLLAFALNQYLMGRYELPRLPLYYLPVGAVALWLLGQLAVLGPALRAAAVPPALATRAA